MKKINILFVSHGGSVGGAEKCLLDLVSYLDKDKFNIYVNIPYQAPLACRLEKAGINYFTAITDLWIPPKSKWGAKHAFTFFKQFRARIWAIETKIQTLNVNIVYSNSITCIDGAIAAYRMGIPHIWHLHENINSKTDLRSYMPIFIIRMILRKLASRYIVPSKRVADQLVAGEAYDTIANGIDITNFRPTKSMILHQELKLDENTKIIAIIGSVIPAKGLNTFIASAIQLLKQSEDKLSFVIVGEGDTDYINQLNQIIIENNQSNAFHFLGRRNDVRHILCSIDILVVASLSEGFSLVTIEAMASSKPVVSTRCGGPEDIIIDGETGFLVPINDSNAISNKLLYLLENPDIAEKMGQNGRERVKHFYTIETYISSIERVILDTLRVQHNR